MSITPQQKGKVKSYQFVSVLDKMIMMDLLKTMLSVLSVIVIIIVSRKFIKVLVKAIEGSISNETVLNILGLNIVMAIDSFLPASIFMSILMVLGRMYRDQEMSAVASAGGGAGVIYKAIFLFVFPLSVISAGLSLIATPWAEATERQLIVDDVLTIDVKGVTAGRFSEYRHGELVFYTERIDAKKRMYNVFVQNKVRGKLGIITAKYGRSEYLPEGLYLILEQGERVQGVPGEVNFIIEKFTEYAVLIENKTTVLQKLRDGKSTVELWYSTELLDIAEIQKRLSSPLGIIFLSFLAVPLAKLSPRGGVYGSLATAFGIYFIYGNLNKVSQSWVAKEVIPSSLGYFWVYCLLFLLGCILLVRLYGVRWVAKVIKLRDVA